MIKAVTRLAFAFVICASTVVGAVAGDGNSAAVLQISPAGSTNGNVLVLDQSAATNSTLAGVPFGEALNPLSLIAETNQLPATQIGEGNHANVTLIGDGATARLLQSTTGGSGIAPLDGNRATILANSAAAASVIQVGLGNEASLTLDPHATAVVSQIGNSNLVSDLSVGAGGDATVAQTGNNNTTGAIIVPPGVMLNYTQTGSGLNPIGSTGVQVFYSTAPGGITITQQGW
jgi:hypothetical protein